MPVRAHNIEVGKQWSAGGEAYNEISAQIADSIEHAVRVLDPKPGERILDLATGTGWTARQVHAAGADTVGVDIAADKVEAAKRLSDPAIRFGVDDAEDLSFETDSFDGVISTFGIQFVTKPEDAAAELARVTKPGGRIALTLWTPDSTVADMFKIFQGYKTAPADPASAPPSPFAWGKQDRIKELLGDTFDLNVERGTSVFVTTDAAEAWQNFRNNFGPSKLLADTLSPERAAALESEFTDFYAGFEEDGRVRCERTYLLVSGTRR